MYCELVPILHAIDYLIVSQLVLHMSILRCLGSIIYTHVSIYIQDGFGTAPTVDIDANFYGTGKESNYQVIKI